VALLVGPPPPELASELEQVRSRARGLSDYLRTVNAPLPEDFPRADILSIAAEMAELPEGTAQGCLSPLEYADTRLADIRSLHFSATSEEVPRGDHVPTLTREEGLDRDLSGLMVAVATARRVANRIAAIEPKEKPAEPSVPRQTVSNLEGVEAQGARLEGYLTDARDDFDRIALAGSESEDQFRRALTDAKVVTGLSRVELAQQNIIPAWLRRFGGWLSNYPTRLEQAGRALEVGVDVVETVHGGWRKYSSRLTDALYSTLREFGADLQGLGRRLGEQRQTTAEAEQFAIGKLKSRILAGETPPVAWTQFVDEMDLSSTSLRELSPLQSLTALQSLTLSDTQVADLWPLATLTALKDLRLARTQVTDLGALKTLIALRSLDLSRTRVTDLSPLEGLTDLETLDLTETRVIDLSPLQTLTSLQILYLSGTRVTDCSPLQGCTALKSLNLSSTRVSDLSPLRTTTALRSLNLSSSQVSDLSPLRTLTALAGR
jgi:hypothetical protein